MSAQTTTTGAEPASTGSVTRSKWAALAVLSVAQLMVILDTTIVNVALPSIQKDLHFKSEADLQWVINAYVLTAGGFLLLGGRVADRYGRRLVFVSGIVVFAAASLSCGLANSPALLVGSRAVQGLGAAFMAPAALSLLTVIFAEGEERNRALGVWSAIAGAGGAVGLLAGGLLTTALSWRWVFFVNLPIAAVAVVASFRLIDESRNPVAGGFDVPGAVTGTAGLGALVFALVRANVWGWASAQTLLVLAAAAVLLTTFVILQLRGRHPLVPPRLFRSRTLVGADVGMLIAGAGLFAVFFFLTLYMQDLLHYSPLKTGIAYLPLSILLVISAGVGSRILGRVGARPILVTGFLLGAGGLALLARLSPTSGYLDLLPSLVLIGTGMGGGLRERHLLGGGRGPPGGHRGGVRPAQRQPADRRVARSGHPHRGGDGPFRRRRPTRPDAGGAGFGHHQLVCVCLHRRRPADRERGGHRRVAATPAVLPSRVQFVESAVTPSPAAVIRQMTRCGCHG